jgi:DNA-binding GntR family transcriptional regulator
MSTALENLSGRERRINLAKRAYDQLKEAIVFGKIRPGDALSENILANALDMSRTPVREALKELANEGLVEISPGRGAFVKEVSIKDIEEICELRTVLECQAAKTAIHNITDSEIRGEEDVWRSFMERVKKGDIIDWETISRHDNEFHSLIIDKCENARLKSIMNTLSSQSLRYQVMAAQALNNVDETIRLQLEVIDLLKERDVDKLVANLKVHIEGTKEIIVKEISRSVSR